MRVWPWISVHCALQVHLRWKWSKNRLLCEFSPVKAASLADPERAAEPRVFRSNTAIRICVYYVKTHFKNTKAGKEEKKLRIVLISSVPLLQLVEILTSGDVACWEFWISEFWRNAPLVLAAFLCSTSSPPSHVGNAKGDDALIRGRVHGEER